MAFDFEIEVVSGEQAQPLRLLQAKAILDLFTWAASRKDTDDANS